MRKVDFGNGRITQDIIMTSLPMLVAQVLSLLYSIVDRIYIGRIPETGTAALGAVGLCFPVIMIVAAFTNMYGMGGAPLFAMALGRGDRKTAGQIMNTAFRLLVMTSVIITAAALLFSVPLLRLFGATDQELPASLSYLRIYILGTFPLMISTGMNTYINAQGYATTGMLTVAIGAVANLLLDPIFIFVLKLGVAGAAIATVLSQTMSLLFVLYFLFYGKNEHPVSFPVRRLLLSRSMSAGKARDAVPDGKRETIPGGLSAAIPDAPTRPFKTRAAAFLPYAGDIISLGTAPFIMQITNSLVQISCNQVLMHTGGALYVSVMTIISSVRSILDVPALAIAEGASPVISYNYGAGKRAYVFKAIRVMMAFCVPYTLIIWLLILLRPQIFFGIFSSDSALMAHTVRGLRLYFSAFIFQSFQYCGQTVFKALGKKKQAIFFSLLRKAVLVVPLTYLLPYVFGFGTDGVFLAEPVSNVIGGLACFITMVYTMRRDPFGR